MAKKSAKKTFAKKSAAKHAAGKTSAKKRGRRAQSGVLGCCSIRYGQVVNRTPNVTQRECREIADHVAGAVFESWTPGDCPGS